MHVGNGVLRIGFVDVEDVCSAAVRVDWLRAPLVSLFIFDSSRRGKGYIHWRFMGRSRSLMLPYWPKISRRWSSLIFLVNFSTTIYSKWSIDISACSLLGHGELGTGLTLVLPRRGLPLRPRLSRSRLGLRDLVLLRLLLSLRYLPLRRPGLASEMLGERRRRGAGEGERVYRERGVTDRA